MLLASRSVAGAMFYILVMLHGIRSRVVYGSNDPATPSDLYLGLYGKDINNKTFTVFKRDNFQYGCTKFPTAPNTEGLPENCKYYGDCCTDPMRIREKLEPGTFSCQTLPSLGKLCSYIVIEGLN